MRRAAYLRWTLAAAITAGLLAATSAGAVDIRPSSDVLVPYFEVTLDSWCRTTLFAVTNSGDHPVSVEATVHTNWGIPVLRVIHNLQPDELWSANLRDWVLLGDLPDRTLGDAQLAHLQAALTGRSSPRDGLYYGTARDGQHVVATGYVTLRVQGFDRSDVLWGDYFVYCTEGNFAQAETLVDIDPIDVDDRLCDHHGIRFLVPRGQIVVGTELMVWTAERFAPAPSPEPISPRVRLLAAWYAESGELLREDTLELLPSEILDLWLLDPPADFGWLDLRTSRESFVTGHYDAEGINSGSLHAWCLPAQPGEAEGPAIDLEKRVAGEMADSPPGPVVAVGSTLAWTFEVTNLGTEALTGISVTDSGGLQVSCPASGLAAGESMVCHASSTAAACQQHNVATVTGLGELGEQVDASDGAYYFGRYDAWLELEKRVNGADADVPPGPQVVVGQNVAFTFLVTNTGSVSLTKVSVSDDAGLTLSCPDTVLDPGEAMTCTASAIAAVGQHADVATASGEPPCGEAVSSSDAGHYFGWQPEPAIDLEKLINGQDADLPPGPSLELGAQLAWTFVVTNTGDVQLTGVGVSDSVLPAVSCPKSVLEVGESMTCVALGTAAACQQANLATASGTPPAGNGPAVSDQDPAYYYGVAHPGLTLEKLVQGQDADTAPGPDLLVGAPVQWTYVVTNTGDLVLAVTVSDDRDAAVSCPKTQLQPAEAMTCTANGTAVAGQYQNVGLAVGIPACGEPVQAMDPAHYYGRSPAIGLEKLTNGEDADTPTGPTLQLGAPVLWTYVVTNTGDSALTSVAVTDDKGVAVTCPKTVLAAGESMTCTAAGIAVAGQYANLGTATGTPGVGPMVTASDPSHYLGYQPLITLEKRVNGQDADTPPGPSLLVGSTIAWTYLVTNTGDVRLTNVSVTDDQGLTVTCPKTALEPGEGMTCTASSSAEAGQHQNIGTATGTPPTGPAVTATDPAHYKGLVPGITLEKLVNGEESDTATGPHLLVGTPLVFTYIVTNTGDVTLTDVTVTDSDGIPVECPETTLAPGETMTCTACGVSALDVVNCPAYCLAIAGQQSNIGRATGTPGEWSPIWAEDPAHYFGVVLGNQGCTPGYWKNHTGSWPPTGYTTSQDVDTVFANVNTFYPSLGDASLLQALGFSGGSGASGAAEILLRAAVAALLNAAHPDVAYPRTEAAVLADVNSGLLQNRDAMLALAAALDADNNRGCPLH